MFKKEKTNIIFTAMDKIWDNSIYKPIPAKNEIPEWYKQTNAYVNGKKQVIDVNSTEATIKKCMPVFDAILAGYLIKLNYDLDLRKTEEGMHFNWAAAPGLDFHPKSQAPLYPGLIGESIPKFINPWIIETPKGYSLLVLNPIHRHEYPIKILEGVVDTDKYATTINFPFQVTDSDFTGLIPAGTVIAQVIPFKRDKWTHSFGGDNERETHRGHVKTVKHVFFDGYKRFFRSIKEFN